MRDFGSREPGARGRSDGSGLRLPVGGSRFPILLLVGIVAIAYADILFFGRGFYVSDLSVYHAPMKQVVAAAVRSGEFPYWNRLYNCGAPLAANPAYELWYPPQWLTYVLPFAFAFQLHILLHFAIAAIGMFLLLRRFELGTVAAVFGSIAFVFCGSYVSLSSKLPLLFSISWAPLALYFTAGGSASPAARPRLPARAFPLALVLAMQFILGEPTMVMQTWALIAGYVIVRRENVKRVALAAVAGVLLAAVQLLPAIDFARDTVRTRAFDFRVVANWSTPAVRFAELLLPSMLRHVGDAGGTALIRTVYAFRADAYLTEIYAGAIVVLLALAGIFAGVRGRWIFAGTMIAACMVAMGEHTPLLRVLFSTGLFSSVRFPEKFLLTAALAIAVWAAVVFDRLCAGDARVMRWAFRLAIAWTAISVILLLAASDGRALGTRRYFAENCVRAALVALWAGVMRRRRTAAVIVAGVALLALDLWYGTLNAVPRTTRDFYDPPPALASVDASQPYRLFHEMAWMGWEGDPAVNGTFDLAQGPAFWWLMRNAAFPEIPASRGIAMALEDDIDLTSLTAADDFREAMKGARSTHVPGADEPYLRMANAGWRVRPRELNEALREAIAGDARRAVVAEVAPAVRAPRYTFAGRLEAMPDAGGFGYAVERNAADPSVAYVATTPFAPAAGRVLRARETANSATIDVIADGRAFLVASVTAHRYWSAAIDGRPAPLIATNLAFQGIVVPPGRHTVSFRYRNPLVLIGGAISLVALLAIVSFRAKRGIPRLVRRRRQPQGIPRRLRGSE